MSSDVSDPSVLEVVTVVGKTVCAGAALTAALYLIRRVCLIMAWKSGGASQTELVNNLRSKLYAFIRQFCAWKHFELCWSCFLTETLGFLFPRDAYVQSTSRLPNARLTLASIMLHRQPTANCNGAANGS